MWRRTKRHRFEQHKTEQHMSELGGKQHRTEQRHAGVSTGVSSIGVSTGICVRGAQGWSGPSSGSSTRICGHIGGIAWEREELPAARSREKGRPAEQGEKGTGGAVRRRQKQGDGGACSREERSGRNRLGARTGREPHAVWWIFLAGWFRIY
jgi:hypothetical protein